MYKYYINNLRKPSYRWGAAPGYKCDSLWVLFSLGEDGVVIFIFFALATMQGVAVSSATQQGCGQAESVEDSVLTLPVCHLPVLSRIKHERIKKTYENNLHIMYTIFNNW